MTVYLNIVAGYKWTMQSLGDPHRKRYGHAACSWEDQLLIIGGAKMYSKEAKQRECLNDVCMFNPATEEWIEVIPEGPPCEPRRYHSACMIGSQLLIYGGINGQNTYLSDLLAINIGKMHDKRADLGRLCRWTQVYTRGHKPGPLAYHTCQLILHPDRYRFPGQISLSSLPEGRSPKPKVLIYNLISCFRLNTKESISLEEEMIKGRRINFTSFA